MTSPIIENITARTRCINLTWSHNKTCCTNGKYTVSWQSEEASTHANKSGSIMISPAEHHLSITLLKPGTMYKVTVSVKCQRYEPKNATVSINTTTSKFMEHIHVYTKLNYHFLLYIFIRNVSLCI